MPAKEVEHFSEEHVPLFRYMIFNCLRSYRAKYGHDYGELIICTDNNSWRKQVFKEYKAHRKTDRDASKTNWNLIFDTIYELQRDLRENFPYKVLNIPGAEADDIIAVLCEYFSTNELKNEIFDVDSPQPILIMSGDKDFIQLHKYGNVKQYSPVLKKWLKPKTTPDAQLRELIITGDRGDGIPNFRSPDNSFTDGIKQKAIFEKKMKNYLTQTPEEFCETDDELKWYRRNEQLIDLKHIPSKVKEDVLKEYLSRKPAPRRNILPYFIKHRMRNMIELVGEF